MTTAHVFIPEEIKEGQRLGRHVEHDENSRNFATAAAGTIVTALHNRKCPPFDQGALGSCTGNAMAGLLMTEPYWSIHRILVESDAIALYEKATHLDRVPGHYPPDDTGSSGLAVMKAAKASKYISAYHHAFGLHASLVALSKTPVIVGVNWYEGFDSPDASGMVHVTGSVRGGHEFELVGVDTTAQTVRACNSWGDGWGDHGYFTFSWADLDRLLHEQGDCTVAVA